VSYPAYAKYRPSDIEWVQSIPADWDECSVKINYLMQLGKMLQSDASGLSDIEITYLKALHVNWNRVTTEGLPKMWASSSELKNYEVQNGDLLVCEGGEVGRAAILEGLDEPAIIQNALHRIRGTASGDVRFFNYLLRNIADAGWFAILCNKATIAHLTVDKLGAVQMPVPSLAEQQQIAAFLDWKTSQIDALIAKKQELLEKLKEKRLAVITQAVTKGLNPDAPMRESGIAWLGDVPKHWDVKRLRFGVQRIEQGWSPQCDNQPAEDDAWGVMKVGCVNGDDFDALENKALPPELEPMSEHELQPKDILISRANTKELLGSAAIVPVDVRPKLLLCDKLFRLRTEAGVDEEFLTCYLRTPAARYQYEREATGASGSMQNIGQGTLKNLVVVLPPLAEQRTIFQYILIERSKLDVLMEKTMAVITNLAEYRIALITAATTGKIDVRQQNPLPLPLPDHVN
jgi:type I restriction enzyme S subunit